MNVALMAIAAFFILTTIIFSSLFLIVLLLWIKAKKDANQTGSKADEEDLSSTGEKPDKKKCETQQ